VQALVNKKYTLPYSVIDALVVHFVGFTSIAGPLPVLWHTSLLCFAQRYAADLTADQSRQITELLGRHSHPKITPDIRRELNAAAAARATDRDEQMRG
jgi:essential nuclear protein 1